jgi:hypothetical protein
MGQREPCRVQFAIASRVVSAYCIAPVFGSCDGRGTSRRGRPVTGRREGSAGRGVEASSVAFLDAVEDIEAVAAGVRRARDGGRVVDAVERGYQLGDSGGEGGGGAYL